MLLFIPESPECQRTSVKVCLSWSRCGMITLIVQSFYDSLCPMSSRVLNKTNRIASCMQ